MSRLLPNPDKAKNYKPFILCAINEDRYCFQPQCLRGLWGCLQLLSDIDKFAYIWDKMRTFKCKTKRLSLQERVIAIAGKRKKAMESINFRVIQLRYCNSCLGQHLPVKDSFRVCEADSKPVIENRCLGRGAGKIFQ